VSAWGTSLISKDEAGSNPASRGTEHQCSSNTLSVEETTGSDDLHGLAGHRANFALNKLGNSWDENGGWDISSVSSTLTTLSADDVHTESKALCDVLWVSDHVHV
jgi:hypothetical protein